mmetsp:Transcript_13377/g.29474  ORF Transcript_13377/g.29474 Transcript_13377/m.29474 type:complete len:220 (-) Transcript_13377:2302-2961(-)
MSNHNRRVFTGGKEVINGFLNQGFTFIVQGARSFIQKQYFRPLHQRACDRDSLFLSPTQSRFFAERCVVCISKLHDEVVRIRFFACFFDLLSSDVGRAIRDIVRNGIVEQSRFLSHVTNLISIPSDIEVLDIVAEVLNGTFAWIIKTLNHSNGRRLALSTWANKRHSLAFLHHQVEMIQDGLVWAGWVRKRDVFEDNVRCAISNRQGVQLGQVNGTISP